MDYLVHYLLSQPQMEYVTIDSTLSIVEQSPGVARFAHPEFGEQAQDCRSRFPELVGFEDQLSAILNRCQNNFKLPGVARSQGESVLVYFDLFVLPLTAEANIAGALIIFLEDVTDRMIREQRLVQAMNELNLKLASQPF
jgi:adenylate cyclase